MSYLLTYLLTRVSSPRCSVSSSKSDCGRLLSGVFACFVRFFRHLIQIAKKNIKNYKNVNPLFLYFLTRTCISDFLLHRLSFLHTPLSHRFLFRPWFSVLLGCNSYFANHKRRKKHTSKNRHYVDYMRGYPSKSVRRSLAPFQKWRRNHSS